MILLLARLWRRLSGSMATSQQQTLTTSKQQQTLTAANRQQTLTTANQQQTPTTSKWQQTLTTANRQQTLQPSIALLIESWCHTLVNHNYNLDKPVLIR